MRVGAAMVDITPPAGTHLAGSAMGERRPAQVVADPLYAKAMAFESGGRKVCVLAVDLCIITAEFTARIRQGAQRLGFEPEAVMVHTIQSHSAPGAGPFMLDPDFPMPVTPETEYLWGTETAYFEQAVAGALAAIEQAHARMAPAQIAAGLAVRDDLAFNRRGVTRDGRVVMPWPYLRLHMPLGPTHICYVEGPTDPDVSVFCARDAAMRIPAMILHHTCHPVNLFATPSSYHAVSADWPGAWAAGMQAAWGRACVPLVLNGCCGNINPWPPFTPDFMPDHRRMGAELTATAAKVVESLKFSDASTLGWRTSRLGLPYRDIPPERKAQVDRILRAHPEPKWETDGAKKVETEWFEAASTKSVEYAQRRWPGSFPYEIQVFRVGDVAFVGLPGEPFVEGQLAIKIGSPAKQTFVVHAVTHYVGYVPTREACGRGGHEANDLCTYWAKLGPGALDMIVVEAKRLLRELFV